MAEFKDVLAQFKSALEKIDGKELVVDVQSIPNNEFSGLQFVNRMLLPQALLELVPANPSLAKPTDNQRYGIHVVQAMFTLVYYMGLGQNENYFVTNAWVPKIINNRTHQVGLALAAFLAAVLSEQEPLQGIDISAANRQILQIMSLELNRAMKVYEFHTLQNIEQSRQWVAYKLKLLANMADLITSYNDSLRNLETKITEATLEIQQGTNLEAKLGELESAESAFAAQIQQSAAEFSAWQQAYADEEIPNTVLSSAFINALAAPIPENTAITFHWLQLYNSPDSVVEEEAIKLDLDRTYDLQLAFIAQTSVDILAQVRKTKAALHVALIPPKPRVAYRNFLGQTKEQLAQSNTALAEAQRQYDDFNINMYRPSVQKITDKYAETLQYLADKCVSLNETIRSDETALYEPIIARRNLLIEVNKKLQSYQSILAKHEGLYVPANDIPQMELKRYLDCVVGEQADIIDAIYAAAIQGSSWMGINSANLSKQVSYYVGLNGNTSADDWKAIRTMIQEKLDLIAQELAVDPTGAVNTSDKPETMVAANNLWDLRLSLKNKFKGLQQLKLEKAEADREYAQLESSMQAELAIWRNPLLELEQILHTENQEYQLHELEHATAKLSENFYQLECIIAGINEAQNRLAVLKEKLESDDVSAAYELYVANREVIFQSNPTTMLEAKVDNEISGLELKKQSLAAINTLEVSAVLLSTELPEADDGVKMRLQECNLELKDLHEKSGRIEAALALLQQRNQILNEAISKRVEILQPQYLLLQLQVEMQSKFTEIMDGTASVDLTGETRNSTIGTLDAYLNGKLVVLNNFDCKNNPDVSALYAKVNAQAQTIKCYYTKLRLGRLQNNYGELIGRFDNIQTNSQKEALLDEVRQLQQQETAFLHAINYPDDEFIRRKLLQVKPLRTQLAQLAKKLEGENKPEETDEEKLTVELRILLNKIKVEYFGSESITKAVFPLYLRDRHLDYWFPDLFRGFAALLVGWYGYKSDASLRQEYIERKLRPAYEAYQEAKLSNKIQTYDALIAVIDQGQQDFKPRKSNYADSLHAKLEQLKDALQPLNNKVCDYFNHDRNNTSSVSPI